MAEVLKDKFTHKQSQQDTVDTIAPLENEAEATIELSASFLAYVGESYPKTNQPMLVPRYFSTYLNILR